MTLDFTHHIRTAGDVPAPDRAVAADPAVNPDHAVNPDPAGTPNHAGPEEVSPAEVTAAPTISVLMPSYNPGEFLPVAISSVLEQLGPADELVIQDARSTDGSAEFLCELAELDPRIRVVVESDHGQSDALNRCLQRAVGDWVLWLNADDMVVDGGIAALRAALESDPDADVAVGAHRIIRGDGSIVDNFPPHRIEVFRLVSLGCAAFSGSIAMRTHYLREIGGFDTDLNTVMDLALQLRMADADLRQVIFDEPLGAFRFHDGSKSANLAREFVLEGHRVRMAHADGPRLKALGLLRTGTHAVEMMAFSFQTEAWYRDLRRVAIGAYRALRG